MTTNYQGNTRKSKEGGGNEITEEKVIVRTATGPVRVKKRGPLRVLKNMIVEADMGSVGNVVWLGIIVPMFKNMLVSSIEQTAHLAVYGDRRAGYRPPPPSAALGIGGGRSGVINYMPQTQYNQAALPTGRPDSRGMPSLPTGTGRRANNSAYLIISKDEAETTLEQMALVIDRWNWVTVADLHEMLGHPSIPNEHRFGWNDVRNAQIRGVRDGWLLELPTPEEVPMQ